jgi:outer membrane protein assembly factor BamB
MFRIQNNNLLLGILFAFQFWVYGLQTARIEAQDSTWSQFLGTSGDGISDASPTTVWSKQENIKWRTVIPGRGWSSPVVVNDKVYLTSAIPRSSTSNGIPNEVRKQSELQADELQVFELSLLILDVHTGGLIKRVPVMLQDQERPTRMHGKNSHASPTPIIANEKIYVHFGYQGTACLSLDGDIEWVNRDLYFPPTHGNGGSPVLVEEMLIFTCDGGEDPKVVALDRATGQLAWEVARKADAKKTFSFCTPSVISVKGQTLVITPGSDKVMAIDPRTGEVVWSFRYTGYSVVPKPIYIDGLVVISTGFDEAKMLAINPVGVGDITETNLVWELDRNVPKTPSMIAHNGLIYSISDDGIALCVQANSGEVQYRKRIGGNYSASPILAGGNLYFTSEQGRTTVIREGVDFEIISECDLEERTLATMALWKNSFLFRTDNALYHISN